MSADVIDGKEFSLRVRTKVAEGVANLKKDYGIKTGCAVVLVGEDQASQV